MRLSLRCFGSVVLTRPEPTRPDPTLLPEPDPTIPGVSPLMPPEISPCRLNNPAPRQGSLVGLASARDGLIKACFRSNMRDSSCEGASGLEDSVFSLLRGILWSWLVLEWLPGTGSL